MRRTIIAAGVLVLLAWPAWAEWHDIEAQGWGVENTTTEKIPHQTFGAGFTGDTHWDVQFDANGAVTPSESAFAHDTYFHNGVPNYKFWISGLEHNETTIGKQICIEVIACASADGDLPFDCASPAVGAHLIYTVGQSGNNFGVTFTTPFSTADVIRHSNVGHAACTLSVGSDCAFAPVRYKIWQNNNLSGCTNPTSATWRARWLHVITQ